MTGKNALFAPVTRMQFKWFITDVDGTLLDDDGNLPQANREALQHCRSLGIPVVLATGRRWTTLQRLIDRLELRELVDFAILNNGMIVKDLRTRTVLHRELFLHATVLQAAETLGGINCDPIVLTYNPDGGPDVFYRNLHLMNRDFVDKNPGYTQPVKGYHELSDKSVVELILLGHEPDLVEVQSAIAGLPLETALIRNTFYEGYMLEMTPRKISKLSGARRLAEILRLSLDDVVAVGDSANDLALLLAAGKSVAVPGAPEAIRNSVHEVMVVPEAVLRNFYR
ncbi:MAG TPA: hypothetical protein DCQ83_00675 [Fibrobacteres bacterium]|nr:hypothetical protein [Fibrobacterota bacterium]